MTRGNQRDINRDRTVKANKEKSKSIPISQKGDNVGLTHSQRMERDAQALRDKAAKKAAAAEGQK
ncbi:hypothetical protein CAOG_07507 [Capsaspora owczarzaki ATCC 30864]|uniref:Small EDRK-rich factor-like N-terminal domain-containing protein n=1 Tax=Capsaspora owczarzaki (strain ATCC 30864) TaxID=595528 RepID=A0A0D2WVV6_CAPO3|nr:hypothetical protein CAOG_07507 [Capsaspora owczarzaki ATCC 30864]KJE97020.1 hypothetical protein CAOG_007507 [Capsaspora owczarzaki ATCC 30864]|eukprot:XP_004343381.1 hypothetical protein CAOG_07507 [Capsaspora owczarzaki ATCC 30864]